MTPQHRDFHHAVQRACNSEERWSKRKSVAFVFCVSLAFWLLLWFAGASS